MRIQEKRMNMFLSVDPAVEKLGTHPLRSFIVTWYK